MLQVKGQGRLLSVKNFDRGQRCKYTAYGCFMPLIYPAGVYNRGHVVRGDNHSGISEI